MQIQLLCIDKTDFSFVQDGVAVFEQRLKHYTKFEQVNLQLSKKEKKLPVEALKKAEAALIEKHIDAHTILVLLDEKGKRYNSRQFAQQIVQWQNTGAKKLAFVVGGAFGFDASLKQKANHLISLSDMTFSHQLIRLIFAEQIYRAFTIIKGEPYHND